MIGTDFRLATAAIKSTKVRSFMTTIAVIIGVMSFVLVTAFIDGFQQTVTSEIDEFGGNLVAANPCNLDVRDEDFNLIEFDFTKSFACPVSLSQADLDDLLGIEGVTAAAPLMMLVTEPTIAKTGDEIPGAVMISTNGDYPEAFNQALRLGRFYESGETNRNIIVGHGISESLFNGGGLGSQLKIRNNNYTIVGVMDEYSLSFSGGFDLNKAIFVPLKAGKAINSGVLGFAEIDIQLEADVDANEYVKAAHAKLLENYGGEDVFSVATQDESLEVLGDILGYVKTVSSFLAYVMLSVGGTVIALIMLIVVKERTREIGIRKSIGATNRNILSQFLIEAVLLSWIGSLIGIGVAYLLGLLIGNATDITPVYTMAGLITVVIISTVIGAISGLIPAAIAAKKDPVEALRDE